MKITENLPVFHGNDIKYVVNVKDGEPIPQVGDEVIRHRGTSSERMLLTDRLTPVRMHGYTMYAFTAKPLKQTIGGNTRLCQMDKRRRQISKSRRETEARYDMTGPVRRTFICKNCGDEIRVKDSRDKRRTFCCRFCENQFYRQQRKETHEAEQISGACGRNAE